MARWNIVNSKIIRWIFFIPISVACAILVTMLWDFINRISLDRVIPINGFMFNLYSIITSGIITGFILVYVGNIIAPYKGAKTVLITLTIIISLITLLSNIFMPIDYWRSLNAVFLVIGSFMARSYLKEEEEKYNL